MRKLRLLREIKKSKRPRLYAYQPYITLLSEQTADPAEEGASVPTHGELLDGAAALATADRDG